MDHTVMNIKIKSPIHGTVTSLTLDVFGLHGFIIFVTFSRIIVIITTITIIVTLSYGKES